jgi:hypothetical protein
MKNKKLMAIAAIIAIMSSGCVASEKAYNAYKNCPLTPDGFNYTLSRDRESNTYADYFGFTWNLKP